MQEHMEKWSQGTYPRGVAESILDHSSRKGYEDPLEYLRDASNFDKSKANRYPPAPDEYYSDGTALWKNLKTGAYVIIDRKGKIRTYGFDEY